MKILHIIFTFKVGGAETMLVDIMNRQLASGDDVSLLIINDGVDPALVATIDPRTKVVHWPRRPGSNKLWLAARLNAWVRWVRPDIIHVHDPKLPGLIRGLDSRMVYTIHDLGLSQHYLRPTVRQAAITEAVRADALAALPAADVEVVLNGIRTDSIRLRESGRSPGVPFSIVQSGRLEAGKKGQDILIRALGELRRRGSLDASVDFIGAGSDRAMLERLAADQGVADRVRFLGLMPRDKVYDSYADYDLMVHPSRYEGFGLIIAEAMAAGLPVAVPTGGGPAEVVCSGRYGELFAPDSPEACADAIERIARNYPAALRRADEARNYALGHYSLDATVDNYRRIYDSLIGKRGGAPQ